MAKKTPERCALILAEADLFGDEITARRWGVTARSIRNYRTRASTDPKFFEVFREKKQMLLSNWQEDATKTIRACLAELNQKIPLAQTEEDAKVILAIAQACKVVGELKLMNDAIAEPPKTP